MKIKLITCMVLSKEVYMLAYKSKHRISINTVSQSLHNTPELLHKRLQEIIDITEKEDDYDAICFAYGLCSNATVGLTSKKSKLVIPRAHDCITLLLGSCEKYNNLYKQYNGGAYWYSHGWVSNELLDMPSQKHFDIKFEEYSKKYDAETAQYLVDIEKQWIQSYNLIVFIKWDEIETTSETKEVKEIAQDFNLEYVEIGGNDKLINKLINGDWDNDDFLVIPPSYYVIPTYNESIIGFSKQPQNVKREKVLNNPH